jgi:hypothetical protein
LGDHPNAEQRHRPCQRGDVGRGIDDELAPATAARLVVEEPVLAKRSGDPNRERLIVV